MIEKIYNTRVLTPEIEGNKLTLVANVEINERIIAKEIWLGDGDIKENWKEITKEEADAYIAEKDKYIEEHFKNQILK